MPSRDLLIDFEHQADTKIGLLGLWDLPLRSVLSTAFLAADGLFVGRRFENRSEPKPHHGGGLLSRLSYLSPWLSKCDLRLGTDIDDALSVIDDVARGEIATMLSYGHLCELMPEVRRGIYRVDFDGSIFHLTHLDIETTRAEERDIIFSELSLAFGEASTRMNPETLDRVATSTSHFDLAVFITLMRDIHRHYLEVPVEARYLPQGAYALAFGFSRDQFRNVRAALLALADLARGLARLYEYRWSQSRPSRKKDALANACIEWLAPCLKASFVLGLVQSVTELAPETIDSVLRHLTIDANQSDFANAGDGYFPPLVRVSDCILFSPHALTVMTPERNLLYVSNRRDPEYFSRTIANELEISLLDDAQEAFRKVPGLLVRRNVQWTNGEIDLLVCDPTERVALQLQAKAAIPPQGSRMTQQVERRALEAIDQINRFDALPGLQKDAICSKVFGGQLETLSWHSAILSRSGIGTAKAWRRLGSILPLNPAILEGAIKTVLTDKRHLLSHVLTAAQSLTNSIHNAAVIGWHSEEIELFGTKLSVPLLDLDHDRIHRAKIAWA